MTAYRDETETLRASVVRLESENASLKADRERLRARAGPSWWSIAGYGAAGALVGVLLVLVADQMHTSLTAPPHEPEALVIHNAWCYRAHGLSYLSQLHWTTQNGTSFAAAYENVTVVIPRDTTPAGWDAAYQDVLIADARDCN